MSDLSARYRLIHREHLRKIRLVDTLVELLNYKEADLDLQAERVWASPYDVHIRGELDGVYFNFTLSVNDVLFDNEEEE